MASGLPVEVLSKILFHLARSDLLSCRLVNQSWNQVSLPVFRKSTFRTYLNICQTGGNAKKYIEFASTQNPQLVLPIHLSLDSFQLPHPKTLEIVTSLKALSGPNSIDTFTLNICSGDEDDDKYAMMMLSKISHALKTLEIKRYYVACTEQLLLDLMKNLEFPSVTSLKYLIGFQRRFMEVQSQFILKCPKLTELYLESESPDVTFPSTLRKLVLKSLTDAMKFRKNILERSSHFRLGILKIYKYDSGDREIIISILECLAKTLQSLTVYVDPMFQFPRLPYLESLRLHSTEYRPTPFWFNLHLNSEKFPALKHVGLCPFVFSIDSESSLPTVKSLTLRLSADRLLPLVDHNSKTKYSMQDNFKNIKITFPNATTICLKEKFQLLQCKTVLKELIYSELAVQIEQIQIKGENRDILGETLEQNRMPLQIMLMHSGNRDLEAEALIRRAIELWTGKIGIKGIVYKDEGTGYGRRILFSDQSHTAHKMINVKKVKIVFGRNGGIEDEFSDYKLNLMSIAKNLPGLTEIEVFGIWSESCCEQFDDLGNEFPNLLLRR